jgi:lactate dehydrogenase-like 2-hydroxyacid dehydrogenase
MLATSRRLLHFDRYTRDGKWAATGSKGPYTATLTGKTVGIIGLGAIGGCVAKRVEGFDCPILYHQRTRRDDLPYAYFDTVEKMAAKADFLVTCCPATPETHHLIDSGVLAALGSDGYVIGVSRGSIVDEDALVAALRDETIAGAGLEVFETEPHIRQELCEMDNVVLSPHRAGFTFEATAKMRDRLLENLKAHFAGRPVPNPVPGFENLSATKTR